MLAKGPFTVMTALSVCWVSVGAPIGTVGLEVHHVKIGAASQGSTWKASWWMATC